MAAIYQVTDMHTAGEPVRIVTAGYPPLVGDTILAKRRFVRENLDHIRRRLMLEPRGHAEMYGVIPTTPSHPDCALAVLFMHNSGYSTMCGHATIAIGRWAVEQGLVKATPPVTRFNLECPCGPVAVSVASDMTVSFESVPAFVERRDDALAMPEKADVAFDIAYGGAFYAILPASRLGLDVHTTPAGELRTAALTVMRAIRARGAVHHPTEPELSFLYSAILTDDAWEPSRHLCVFGEGQIDRSATGSGVTARLAVDAARGRIAPGGRRTFAGASGVPFHAELLTAETLGPHRAWRVRVSGSASYSGNASWTVEDADPLRDGFSIDDMASLPIRN